MAEITLILGGSGSGKSRSIKNLPSKRTFVISVVENKRLPFAKSSSLYTDFNFETGEGNILRSKSIKTIAKVLRYINEHRPEIRFVILDDAQYLSLFTYTSRIDEKDWAKFNTIIANTIDLIDLMSSLRKDIMVFILQHIENGTDAMGDDQIQAKTLGKFIKEKLTYEGLFDTVLLCDKEEEDNGEVKHFFWTRKSKSTVKSSEGLFTEQKIPNDLLIVAKAIHEYYN